MAVGRSLHIGLNSVDPAAYNGWSGDLAACEFDANDMQTICQAAGLTTTSLLTSTATAEAVLGAVDKASAELVTGDLFVMSYAGHGGQIPDENSDEPDDLDETWVLYDRQVIDDELYQRWAQVRRWGTDRRHLGLVPFRVHRQGPTRLRWPWRECADRRVHRRTIHARRRQHT